MFDKGHGIKYRMDRLIKQGQTELPTSWGNFTMIAYSIDPEDQMPHLAMVHEDFNPNGPVYLRIHSECLTGDLFPVSYTHLTLPTKRIV